MNVAGCRSDVGSLSYDGEPRTLFTRAPAPPPAVEDRARRVAHI